MKFIKLLILLIIISSNAYAGYWREFYGFDSTISMSQRQSPDSLCNALMSKTSKNWLPQNAGLKKEGSTYYCNYYINQGKGIILSYVDDKCDSLKGQVSKNLFLKNIPSDDTACLKTLNGDYCQFRMHTIEVLKTLHDGKYRAFVPSGVYTGYTCSVPEDVNSGDSDTNSTLPPKPSCTAEICEPVNNLCPFGYSSGYFNNKMICTRNSIPSPNQPDKPEPDKPEPDKPEPDKPEPDKPEPDKSDSNSNGGGASSSNGSFNNAINNGSSGSASGGISGNNTGSAGVGADSNSGNTDGNAGDGKGDGEGKDDGEGDGIFDFLKDFFKDDLDKHLPKDTGLDIPVPNVSKPNTNVRGNAYCPAPLTVPYSFAGVSGQFVFTFEYICKICSFLKPVVIAVATFISALIVTGTATRGD